MKIEVVSDQHLVQPSMQTQGKKRMRMTPNKRQDIKRRSVSVLLMEINCTFICYSFTASEALMWPVSLIRPKTALHLKITSFPSTFLLAKLEFKPEREKPQQSPPHKMLV